MGAPCFGGEGGIVSNLAHEVSCMLDETAVASMGLQWLR